MIRSKLERRPESGAEVGFSGLLAAAILALGTCVRACVPLCLCAVVDDGGKKGFRHTLVVDRSNGPINRSGGERGDPAGRSREGTGGEHKAELTSLAGVGRSAVTHSPRNVPLQLPQTNNGRERRRAVWADGGDGVRPLCCVCRVVSCSLFCLLLLASYRFQLA